MCSTGSVWAFPQTGCPIRKSPDHHSLPTPRRLSQVAASFIGAWCLGIHLRPLVACLTYDHSSLLEVGSLIKRIQLIAVGNSTRISIFRPIRLTTYWWRCPDSN